nr:immunoglobulin light chain junction region [Macaca mulatta]MOW34656.1 immunoglobulin light chain junction region [Macaca mulatta]MOW35243.1 immunoglobulin light chain junction region [Macaca mulatta]MOW35610.1 immunoglobulin light chain junction region [Macaca mulatta]
CQGYSDSLFTF